MKATELVKKSLKVEDIFKMIEEKNLNGHFKYFIPHFLHVSEEVILTLIKNGFKVYKGDWDSNLKECWIIEW
jgi:hypothetical protein